MNPCLAYCASWVDNPLEWQMLHHQKLVGTPSKSRTESQRTIHSPFEYEGCLQYCFRFKLLIKDTLSLCFPTTLPVLLLPAITTWINGNWERWTKYSEWRSCMVSCLGGPNFRPYQTPKCSWNSSWKWCNFRKSSLTPIANRLANHWRRDRNLSQSSTGNRLAGEILKLLYHGPSSVRSSSKFEE
jgi:hypothetical protein